MILEINEDLEAILATGELPAKTEAMELIVFELYRERRISSGKAAQLLGEPREDFLHRAGRRGIPYIEFTPTEIAEELAEAARLTRDNRR